MFFRDLCKCTKKSYKIGSTREIFSSIAVKVMVDFGFQQNKWVILHYV